MEKKFEETSRVGLAPTKAFTRRAFEPKSSSEFTCERNPMNPGNIFLVVNLVAFITWLALMARPRHPLVLRTASLVVPLLLAALYAIIIAMRMGRAEGDFSSLAGVASLFRDPWILLAGWVHYLAFDLLIGVWEVRDAAARNMPQWLVVPCLVLTFLFGPAGWLLYIVVRTIPPTIQNSASQSPR